MGLMNWLDLENKLAELLWDVEAYRDFTEDQMRYDEATSFCSDCPLRSDDTDGVCCKDTGNYFSAGALEHISQIQAIAKLIRQVVSSESLQKSFEARKK